jgi:hypothetical protein
VATTYQTTPFNSGIYYQPVNGVQGPAHQEVARIYGNGDIVQLVRPERGLKLTGAKIAMAQLDSNGAPTLTATLRANNGVSQQNIALVTAAQAGAAAGSVVYLNVPSALGWIVPARGWWFELLITAGPATGASGAIYWEFDLTAFCYNDEDVTRPPTN